MAIGDIVKFSGNLNFQLYCKKIEKKEEGEETNDAMITEEPDTFYCIYKIRVREHKRGEICTDVSESTIVKGEFIRQLEPNKTYIFTCKEIEDPKYGTQYNLLAFSENIDLTNVQNQQAFLKYFLTEKQIQEFYRMYENPLAIIDSHNIELITKVKGIKEKTALRILREFDKRRDYSGLCIEFANLNITQAFIQKLERRYHSLEEIARILREDPYQLSFDVDGIGFKTADKIAMDNGMSPKDVKRIRAFINFHLSEIAENGDSYTTAIELQEAIKSELGYDIQEPTENNSNNIKDAIDSLIKEKKLVLEDNEVASRRRVFLKKYYDLEKDIAKHFKRLMKGENTFIYDDWESIVAEQEKEQGWQFTDEQKAGIKLGLDNQVCFITGSAGTGKSSLVSGILRVLEGYEFAQCSLSGKAAARLQEVTGKEGSTIHKLLGYNRTGFTYTENNPLDYSIIVVDELSMIGGEIFLSLIQAIKDGAKLIMLGDMGQLESIGSLNLANDVYESGVIPTVTLTKIHRQAQKSGIITSAYRVRNQLEIFDDDFEGDAIVGELQDMEFCIAFNRDLLRPKIMEKFKEYYNGELVKKNIMKLQVLVSMKERGNICVKNLNQDIQAIVNPITDFDNYIESSFGNIHNNDKVMCIKNSYGVFTTEGDKTDIFNGWVGTVMEIEADNNVIIYFPIINKEVILSIDDTKNSIILGYASTVHKWQGSSAKVVICGLDRSTPPKMLNKELLYTMLTRAEKKCVLVGENAAIKDSISKSGISEKRTFLKELLKND